MQTPIEMILYQATLALVVSLTSLISASLHTLKNERNNLNINVISFEPSMTQEKKKKN